MVCPRCAHSTTVPTGRCPACGAIYADGGVVTLDTPIDTTGLPHTATAAPSTRLNGGTTTIGPTVAADAINPAGAHADAAHIPGGALRVGQSFGARYHIIKVLGVGGMGAVYQAWDAELNVGVALKVIRTDAKYRSASSEAQKRFKQELLLARQVTHKNVVRIHDLGEIDGIKYITMPYVHGADLATVLKRQGKLPIPRALHLARQFADGLQAAHEAGVIHRDLKPANVMIGADDQALIMDFGISASADRTSDSGIVGTLEYMAPEQGRGELVDGRADIYAFGLILYEVLSGPRRLTATTPVERLAAMRRRSVEGVAALRTIDESIPAALDAFVSRCLEREPAARFQTTEELVAALAKLDDNGESIPEPARISKRVLAVSTLLMLMLLGGMYVVGRRTAPVQAAEKPAVSVLIADFENRTGNHTFEDSIEQALALSMEGASFLTAYSRDDAKTLANRLQPGSTLTERMAQAISTREGIKYVLAGSVETAGSRIRLAIRAIDPTDGHAVTTVTGTAARKEEVLKTVGALAVQLRQALGDTKPPRESLAAMDPVTTTSLEAIQAYSRAQNLSLAGKSRDALKAFEQAIALDPSLGRAYAGMAVIYGNLKRDAQAEEYFQKALKYVDRMTEREKYRTIGSYYFLVAHNYEKAIENYETLVRLYPADNSGHANLAFAYLMMGNFEGATREGRRAIEIYPRNLTQRSNYAMYAMYASDFKTATAEANTVLRDNPEYDYAILTLARAKLAQGDIEGARAAYRRLREVSALGATMATVGEADLAMYRGKYRDAIRMLEPAILVDERAGNSSDAATKYIPLAEARLAVGDAVGAAAAALKATTLSRQEGVQYPAARILIETGRRNEAEKVASDLENMLQRQTIAFARLLDGELSLKQNRLATGLEALRDSQKRYDSWFSHYLIGRTWVQAGHFAEALPELEWCFKRRGLAADVFIADLSTLRYFPAVQYWLARAQEGLGASDVAGRNYQEFVTIRSSADPPDPLVVDAQRRLASSPRPSAPR